MQSEFQSKQMTTSHKFGGKTLRIASFSIIAMGAFFSILPAGNRIADANTIDTNAIDTEIADSSIPEEESFEEFDVGLNHELIDEVADLQLVSNDGTLPLRLNDGTLPLRLLGAAQLQASSLSDVSGRHPSESIGATQPTNARLNAQLTLTRVTNSPLRGPAEQALNCQLRSNAVSKHSASGSLSVGGIAYNVRGICFDHNSQTIEMVTARSERELASLIGPLQNAQLDRLRGQLRITGSNQSGRYAVDLNRAP